MAFTTIKFIIFLLIAFTAYFLTPKKYRWCILLAASYVFYLFAGVRLVFFLLFTTVTTYFTGKVIGTISDKYAAMLAARRAELSKEERKSLKEEGNRKKKRVMVLALLANFGILVFLKYINDITGGVNSILGLFTDQTIPSLNLVIPLGISFYTFQSMGYVIDVYRGKYAPERNLAKLALFVSFFPQLVQGPISRFDDLAHQLFEPHSFDYNRAKMGIELMLWGYFKKMVIADRIAIPVQTVFDHYETYPGFFILIAGILYCVQIYTDFSGGMDIAAGAAKIIGIELPQNFERPYFAKTLPEYWRRWHITLNRWLRDYVFYPISLSKPFVKLGKVSRKAFGLRFGKNLAIYLATLIVRIINAIWHGGDNKYIISGVYHGLLIIIGLQAQPFTDWLKVKLKVNTECFSWRLFQMLRTFTFVLIGRIMLHAGSVKQGFDMLVKMVTELNPWILFDGSLYELGLSQRAFWVMIVSIMILFFFSTLKELGYHIRETLGRQNIIFQWIVILACIFGILILGIYGPGYTAGEFIYQQF